MLSPYKDYSSLLGVKLTYVFPYATTELCWCHTLVSRRRNQSLYTCAADVQITRIVNNMVNRYNISFKLQAKILENDNWVRNMITESSAEI
jgi:hypothetical protein